MSSYRPLRLSPTLPAIPVLLPINPRLDIEQHLLAGLHGLPQFTIKLDLLRPNEVTNKLLRRTGLFVHGGLTLRLVTDGDFADCEVVDFGLAQFHIPIFQDAEVKGSGTSCCR